jgi:hypothetical protein
MSDERYGTLDDLLYEAAPLVVADEAASFLAREIDPLTGTELTPGKPDECLGGDNYPEYPLCCDECDFYLACYPDAMPQK